MSELLTLANITGLAETGALVVGVWILAGVRHELRSLVRRVDQIEAHIWKRE